MPLYEYVCRECRRGFEMLILGGDVPSCPRCRTTDLERVLSVTAIGRGSDTAVGPAPAEGGGCGRCGDPRGPGACALD